MQYSIWIVPKGKPKDILTGVVENLAKKYQGPIFEPHMTLLGPINESKIDVINKTKKLAKQLSPFRLELGEIDYSSTYFQCIFVRVRSNPDLIKSRISAQEIFNIDTFFMPHISLYCGNIDSNLRAKIANGVDLPKIKFTMDELIITPSTEDPSTWKYVSVIKLQ